MSTSFKISERAQVVSILVLAVIALVCAWQFLLWPQFRQREDNRKIRDELEKRPIAKFTEGTLRRASEIAREASAALNTDWSATARRLSTILNVGGTSIIEYRVQYENIERNLRAKAKSLNIKLPATLGVDSSVKSTEVLRERLLQLKTVEKLVDLVFNQHIDSIASIKTLPTVLHYDTEQKLICEEYPVEVEFATPFESLFYLFSGIFEKDSVFTFSKIRVTSDPLDDEILHTKAVMSSLIFP